MRSSLIALSAGLALTLAAGCGSDSTTPTPDGAVKPADGTVVKPDNGIAPDGPVVTPDQGIKPDINPQAKSILQSVVNTIRMPASAKEYACDIDGTGAKNAFGGIAGALKILPLQGMDFQSMIDSMMKDGDILLLFNLTGMDLVNDSAARLQGFVGEDTDGDATNNFSGTASLKAAATSPKDLVFDAKIASSQLITTPGNIVLPIPGGATPISMSVAKTIIQAKVSSTPASAMTSGQICGAIPWTEVDQKLLPMIAENVNSTYQAPSTSQTTKDLLKNTFDANKDGTITADEIRNNALLKMFLKADVDTNGDKTVDAMSIGVGFSAVACKIQP